MSFGYGVGDVIAVGQLAWTVYKGCRDAPGSFNNISQEVLSLHAVLKEVEECLSSQPLSTDRQSHLKDVTGGCGSVLKDLQALVDKYRTLDTKSKRTWDRVGFASENTAELRSRLTANTGLLTAYMVTTQVYVARKLNDLMRDFQAGRHECSVVSTQSLESISREDKEIWRTIRKELADIGISIAAFDANKTFIMDWFKKAIDNGAFEEEAPDDISNSIGYEEEAPDGISSSIGYDDTDSQTTEVVTSNSTSTAEFSESKVRAPARVPRPSSKSQKQPVKRPALVVWLLQYKKKLREAVENNDQARVLQLLENGVNPNMMYSGGLTALYWALRNGHTDIIQLLLEKGADVNTKDN